MLLGHTVRAAPFHAADCVVQQEGTGSAPGKRYGENDLSSLSPLFGLIFIGNVIALAIYVCRRLCAGHGLPLCVCIYGVDVSLCTAPCTDNLCLGRDRGASPRGAFGFVVDVTALTRCH